MFLIRLSFFLLLLGTFQALKSQSCAQLVHIQLQKDNPNLESLGSSCQESAFNILDSLFSVVHENLKIDSQGFYLQLQEQVVSRIPDSDGSVLMQGQYHFNLGLHQKNLNDLNGANASFDHILGLFDLTSKLPRNQAEIVNLTLHQLSEIAALESNYHQAIKHLIYSIDIENNSVEGTGSRPLTESSFNRLGIIYSNLGENKKAYEYFKEGNAAMKRAATNLPKKSLSKFLYIFIGYFNYEVEAALELNYLDEASEVLQIIDHLKLADHRRNFKPEILKASYFNKLGQKDSMNLHLARALKIADSEQNRFDDLLTYHLTKGLFFKSDEQMEEALSSLDSALHMSQALQEISPKWSKEMLRSRLEKVVVLEQLQRYGELVNEVELFLSEINIKLAGALIFEDRLEHIDEFYPLFEKTLDIISEFYPERMDLAFELIECTKAVSLYKDATLAVRSKNSKRDSLILVYKNLTAAYSKKTLESRSQTSSAKLRQALYETEKLLEKVKAEIQEDHATEPLTNLAHYQSSMKKRSVHVLTFAGKNNYYFQLITSTGTRLIKLPLDTINSNVEKHLLALNNYKTFDFEDSGHQLYSLLEDVLTYNNTQNIIFSADGLLTQIPLESLRNHSGDFMLDHYNFYYSPSARIKYFLEESKTPREIKAAIFRPSAQENEVPLDFAIEEATELTELLKADLFEKEAANKESFIKQSEEYGILHLATHARGIDKDPSLSYITFTKSKLGFDEIRSLVLQAELVCLSACETNIGQNYNGEGVQSLARNFIASGAKSVISSLWSIPDQTTSEITVSFYRYLKKGMSKSSALRQAKMDFIEAHPYEGRHPYYWAGLTLNGNDAALYPSRAKWYWGLGIVGLLIVLLIIYKFFKPLRPREFKMVLG